MKGDIACHCCDLLVNVADIRNGDTASCSRCGEFLTRYRSDAYQRVLAFASTGLIFLIMSSNYPFLSLSSSGLENVMTLSQTPGALWKNGMEEVAVLVAAFIIAIPAATLLMLIALSIPLSQDRYYPWLTPLARAIFVVQDWSMAEVFIVAVIVSLVKIAALATVVIGISFWAYAAFVLCMTLAIASLDRYQCWERIETLETG